MPIDGNATILIVEDEYMIAFDLADAVEDAGYHVVGPAHDVAEGLRLATEEPIDLAILDINLDDDKSYPVADLLAQRGIPFIFVTGQNGEIVPSRFCTLPICLKPMNAAAVVAEALGHAEAFVSAAA